MDSKTKCQPFTDSLRERLCFHLEDTGTSQCEAAEGVGLSQSAVSKFLRGGGIDYEHGVVVSHWLEDGQAT